MSKRGVVMVGVVMMCMTIMSWRSQAGHRDSARSTSIEVAPDLEVLDAQVGAFHYDDALQRVIFTPATSLEMIPGKTYGWRLKLNTSRAQVDWVETMSLPSAPAHWGISSDVSISFDRTTATTRGSSTVDAQGYISNYWIFSEGDPLGKYAVRITLDRVDVVSASVQVD